jgi:hypothetical protein
MHGEGVKFQQKNSTKLGFILVAIALFLTVASVGFLQTSGLLNITQTVPTSGHVTAINLGVYADGSCSEKLTSMDWGSLSPGDIIYKAIYVKNTGNSPVNIHMTTDSWNPTEASNSITLAWDKENAVLNPGEVAIATLTLSVAANISGINDFTFDIIIAGIG